MRKVLSRVFRKLFPNASVMVNSFYLLSHGFGHWRSIREKMAVDAVGVELPWYTYPAIEYLSAFDFSKSDIFEFGSGNSSVFWAKRANSVCSVESNHAWFEIVNNRKQPNQILLHREDQLSYVRSIAERRAKFDVIVIDGMWRKECAEAALQHLKNDGMIVLDNSDRHIEKGCSEIFRNEGFIQVDFSGFGPINDYCWSTSVFIKTPYLQRNFDGPKPVGGIQN